MGYGLRAPPALDSAEWRAEQCVGAELEPDHVWPAAALLACRGRGDVCRVALWGFTSTRLPLGRLTALTVGARLLGAIPHLVRLKGAKSEGLAAGLADFEVAHLLLQSFAAANRLEPPEAPLKRRTYMQARQPLNFAWLAGLAMTSVWQWGRA